MSQKMTATSLEVTTLVDLLRWRAREKPSQMVYTFLTYGEASITTKSITYQELDLKARAVARLLQENGGEGKQVLLLYPSGLDYMVAYFGCLYAHALAVPAYPPHSQRALPRIQAIVADAGISIVLTTVAVHKKVRNWMHDITDVSHMQWFTTDDMGTEGAEQWTTAPEITGDTLAFLQYTSGSTSTPKGVMVSHANLLHNLSMIYTYWELNDQSVGVSWLPIFHDMGLIAAMLLPLYGGFPAYFMAPTDFLLRPQRWLQAITDYKGTHSCAPNFAYELCLKRVTEKDFETLDLSSWKIALNGAEPVRAETLHRFTKRFAAVGFRSETFMAGFGLAEGTLMVSIGQLRDEPYVKSISKAALEENFILPAGASIDDVQQLVGCGPIRGEQHQVVIVNPHTHQPCRPEEVGEIWVASPSVAQGYWQRPVESAKTFQARLSTGEGPFLRTGDLGASLNDNIFVTGRLKDLIILAGRNYYPQDIELTVERSHPAIRPTCCVAFSVEQEQQERLIVLAEVDHRYSFDVEMTPAAKKQEIARNIRKDISDYHELLVDKVVLLRPNGIHKTSSGKVQRRACREAFLQEELSIWNG